MIDENLPLNLTKSDTFNAEEKPRMMVCPECNGDSEELSDCCGAPMNTDIMMCSDCKDHCGISVCDYCDGKGEVEMTVEDIAEENNKKLENKSEL